MELFEAVSENNIFKVMQLLETGIDPNQFDQDRHYNALHYAVRYNAQDIVLLLVTAGADLDALTEENLSVYDLASQHRHEAMLSLLLKLSHMRQPKYRYYLMQ